MKKYQFYIILLAIVLACLGIFVFLGKSNNVAIEKIRKEYNLPFAIDLQNLNYQLPKYTEICKPNFAYACFKGICNPSELKYFILLDAQDKKFYTCNTEKCLEEISSSEGMTGTEIKFTDNKISVSKVIGTGKRGAWSNENIDIVGNKFTRKIENSDIISASEGTCNSK